MSDRGVSTSPNQRHIPDDERGARGSTRGVRRASAAMVAPATLLAVLRILSSYSWLSGALLGPDAKLQPAFLSGKGLLSRVNDGPGAFAARAAFPAVGHWLPGFVAAFPAQLAWLVALGELAVGLSLLLGLLTRVGGLFAIVQAVMQWLVAGGNGADTVGHNWMLGVAGLVVLIAGAGRRWGADAALLTRCPRSRLLRIVA